MAETNHRGIGFFGFAAVGNADLASRSDIRGFGDSLEGHAGKESRVFDCPQQSRDHTQTTGKTPRGNGPFFRSTAD